MLETLKTLTNDTQWRVRMAVYDLVAELAIEFGKTGSMESKL